MTPKEKAIELYNTFRDTMTVTTGNYRAKKQALICVDEIIKTYIHIDPKLNFWNQVREEIKNI